MTLSTKLAIYSSLIFLLWITIPPECSSKSLNTTTESPPVNSTTLDPMSYEYFLEQIRIIDEQRAEFHRRNIRISEEGEEPWVYYDTETNTTWSWSPPRKPEMPWFRRFAEFFTEHITMITSVCLVLMFIVVIVEVLRHFLNRLDEQDEYGHLINVNIPKTPPCK